MQNKLYCIKQDSPAQLLIENVELVESFFARGKGLLGRKFLGENQGMWIKPCNNIHTFFMNFSIDCIFVDRKMKIEKIVSQVKPYRVIGPFWKAHSVIEVAAGQAEKWNLKKGDQLYVVN